jgi:sialidase-1
MNDDIQVMVCPATPDNPRNSEAAIVVLRDGTLLLAYSRFYGGTGDESAGEIAGKTSTDGGRTWSEHFTIQANDGQQNVMEVNMLRLQSGRIGLIYARKNSDADCEMYWRVSGDEAKTWSAETKVNLPGGYGATGPDVAIQLSSGRILVPDYRTADWVKEPRFHGRGCYSDDEGATWQYGERIDVPDGKSLEEPAIVELKDGRILMYIRTAPGPIYQCFSADQGVTWTVPEPSPLVHPTSPMQLKRIPSTGDLVCIWNNSVAARYPLTAALSADEGQTWLHFRDLEVETPGVSQFAYASLTFHDERALMTYWVIDGAGMNLKFRSLPVSWFYAA